MKIYRKISDGVLHGWTNPNQDPKVWQLTDIPINIINSAPPPPNTIVVEGPGPAALQAAIDLAKEGDTVLVKDGTYTSDATADNDAYAAVVRVKKNNITLKAYPGHKPVIDARAMQTWGIAVSDQRANVPPTYKNIVIDGFTITGANRNGIRADAPEGLTIRNCVIHTNNAGFWKYGAVSYEYGVMIIGGKNVTVEGCRIYNNGGGINFYENETVTVLDGCKDAIVRNCFIYANANSGNLGNSSGIACRFTERIKVYDCVLYDGCDANINGLGAIHSQFTRNVLLNAYQAGGNNEGIKFCVRGGGNNLVAFNVIAYNANTGYDATDGVGDVFLNNTVYKNKSWNMLLEGSNTLTLNTISTGGLHDEWPRDFRPPNSSAKEAVASQTSYNLFSDSEHDITYFLEYVMPNTVYSGNPQFAAPWDSLPRNNTVVHPEEYFGIPAATIEKVQLLVAAKFKPLSPHAGCTESQVISFLSDARAAMLAKAKARIALWKDDPDTFQHRQAAVMWQRMVDDIESGRINYASLPVLKDLAGTTVSNNAPLNLGAIL